MFSTVFWNDITSVLSQPPARRDPFAVCWNDDAEPDDERIRAESEGRPTDSDKEVIDGENLRAAKDEIDPRRHSSVVRS